MTFINAMSSKRYYDDAMAVVEDMVYGFSSMKKVKYTNRSSERVVQIYVEPLYKMAKSQKF